MFPSTKWAVTIIESLTIQHLSDFCGSPFQKRLCMEVSASVHKSTV